MANWKNRIIGHGDEPVDAILFNPANWRIHPKAQQDALTGVLESVGWVQDVIVNKRTGHLVDGHLRCQVAGRNGEKTVPVVYVDLSEEEEALILATIDPLAGMATTDRAKLETLLHDIQSDDERVQKLVEDVAEKEGLFYDRDNQSELEGNSKNLSDKFIVPPFSVLDARQGYWQERKRMWIDLGIESELGRGECVTWTGDAITEHGLNYYRNRKGREVATSYSSQQRLNALQKTGDSRAVDYGTAGNVSEQSGTSIFDPVLCELAYRWFTPKNGKVLDPFAGGSVRGIVASKLGYQYTGIDLRQEQIDANNKQADELCKDNPPKWFVGDSRNVKAIAPDDYDLIFSCPPYFDLELYSDDELDLSNSGDYKKFITDYRAIIADCVAMLKDNRFACFVVGDVRDKGGFYRNFPADTIAAFQDAGMTLYNEAILVTAVGSLPIRVGRQFGAYRKLGKTHQNVLVFYKGDPRLIKEFGDVEAGDPEDYQ